jgi:hypothetical protein
MAVVFLLVVMSAPSTAHLPWGIQIRHPRPKIRRRMPCPTKMLAMISLKSRFSSRCTYFEQALELFDVRDTFHLFQPPQPVSIALSAKDIMSKAAFSATQVVQREMSRARSLSSPTSSQTARRHVFRVGTPVSLSASYKGDDGVLKSGETGLVLAHAADGSVRSHSSSNPVIPRAFRSAPS